MAGISSAHFNWLVALLLGAVLVGGCAVKSSNVEPVSGGEGRYFEMDCATLAKEEQRLTKEVADLSREIDEGSTSDRVAMGVGVVFWPVLFLIDGNGREVDELAAKKGALIDVSNAREDKGCNIPQRQVDTKPKSDKVARRYPR